MKASSLIAVLAVVLLTNKATAVDDHHPIVNRVDGQAWKAPNYEGGNLTYYLEIPSSENEKYPLPVGQASKKVEISGILKVYAGDDTDPIETHAVSGNVRRVGTVSTLGRNWYKSTCSGVLKASSVKIAFAWHPGSDRRRHEVNSDARNDDIFIMRVRFKGQSLIDDCEEVTPGDVTNEEEMP